MIKKSRQREAILQCLVNRYDHPTAETVYLSIKDSDLGEIQKITVNEGPDRFDGNPAPHYHFSCRGCGCVMDLDLPQQDNLNKLAAEKFPGIIEKHTVQFYGLCPDCAKKQTS